METSRTEKFQFLDKFSQVNSLLSHSFCIHGILAALCVQKGVCLPDTGCFSLGLPLKVLNTNKLIEAKLDVSRMIYVNVDSPNLDFPYLQLGEPSEEKNPCTLQCTNATNYWNFYEERILFVLWTLISALSASRKTSLDNFYLGFRSFFSLEPFYLYHDLNKTINGSFLWASTI